ncbi:unnamed protein product [Closterium sp. NIES-54]
MVTTTTPGGQRVSICTCTQTPRHLATFTLRPGSSLYTLATKPPHVAASAQVSASGPVALPWSCRLLSHQTLLWHHHLGHPSLPRLRGTHSRLLVSVLPRSLSPLPPSLAPPCLPCAEGRQCAAPHSSFPLTTAPLQTLHMDVWGPARVSEQGRERDFLLVVDDYTRYTTVFPLRSKGEFPDVLIPWIHAIRLQLRERFREDLTVLRLHFNRGGEFSCDLLRDFCRGEGILQTFMFPNSPQQNGVAECHIGLVMEVAHTSMIHAAAPHFLWPFAVRYAAHQLNLWPRVSLPETSPTPCWTGKVGDVSVFRVWGSRAFVRDMSADKLSARAIHCVFLGFPPDALCWQFYHPTSRRVLPSQDVTFDESVPFYHLFPYRSAPLPPPPLFLAPGSPPVDPLPHRGPAPSCVSQVDQLSGIVPVEVVVDSGAARGAASGGAEPSRAEPEGAEPTGAEPGGAKSGGAEPGGAEPGGAKPTGAEPGGAESEGAESGCAKPRGNASSRGPAGASPRLSTWPEPLSPQQLREWFAQCTLLRSGATGAGGSAAGDTRARGAGATSLGGAGVPTGAGGTGGAGAAGPRGARTRGTGASRASARGARAGDPGAGGAGSGDSGASDIGPGGAGAVGTGAEGAGAIDPGAGGAGAGGAVSSGTGAGGTVQRRPFFVPPPQWSLPPPDSVLHQIDSFTERREPASRPTSPVRDVRTGRRVPRLRPPPVPDTHVMALRPSSIPLRVPLPPPPESSLPAVPDPESGLARAASPTVSRLLATVVTDPSFESTTASALVAEVVDFAAAFRLDYATSLVAESKSASPPSVGGECALGTDVLEDRQENFECLATAVPHLVAMLLAPEGDPDAPDIPTPRSYTEAITGPYSSQWQTTMDAEMASWKSTGTYIDAVPPSGANIVLQHFGFRYSSPQSTPLPTGHSLSAPPSNESVEPSGPYPELVGCLIHRPEHWQAAKRVLRYLCSTSGMGLVLGGRGPVVLTGHADASWVEDLAMKRSSQCYTFSLGSGSVSWQSTRSSSVLSSSCEAEIYAGTMAAQELCYLTYLLTDLGERPRSPPVIPGGKPPHGPPLNLTLPPFYQKLQPAGRGGAGGRGGRSARLAGNREGRRVRRRRDGRARAAVRRGGLAAARWVVAASRGGALDAFLENADAATLDALLAMLPTASPPPTSSGGGRNGGGSSGGGSAGGARNGQGGRRMV